MKLTKMYYVESNDKTTIIYLDRWGNEKYYTFKGKYEGKKTEFEILTFLQKKLKEERNGIHTLF